MNDSSQIVECDLLTWLCLFSLGSRGASPRLLGLLGPRLPPTLCALLGLACRPLHWGLADHIILDRHFQGVAGASVGT